MKRQVLCWLCQVIADIYLTTKAETPGGQMVILYNLGDLSLLACLTYISLHFCPPQFPSLPSHVPLSQLVLSVWKGKNKEVTIIVYIYKKTAAHASAYIIYIQKFKDCMMFYPWFNYYICIKIHKYTHKLPLYFSFLNVSSDIWTCLLGSIRLFLKVERSLRTVLAIPARGLHTYIILDLVWKPIEESMCIN